MSKKTVKRFKSKTVKGKQRSLPMKGLKAPKVAKTTKPKRQWKHEWGQKSPLVNVRLPQPLARAWNKHVGKRSQSDMLREAIAKACGFNLASLAKGGE